MANEGKIRASDLLDEKALILFRELEQITIDNIKAIEKLKETNIHLNNTTMKSGKDSIALQQTIKQNLIEIDTLRKAMVQKELEMIGTQQSADSKRKAMHNKEMKRIKDKLTSHEKFHKEEKAAIKNILNCSEYT